MELKGPLRAFLSCSLSLQLTVAILFLSQSRAIAITQTCTGFYAGLGFLNRTSADYLTQTSPPIIALVVRPDGSKVTHVHDKISGPPAILSLVSIPNLYKLISSDNYANFIAAQYLESFSPSPEFTIDRARNSLRRAAAIMLSRVEMPNPAHVQG